MSADWYDGMVDTINVETKQFVLDQTSRIYFDGAQFPQLVSSPGDIDGLFEFSGTIAHDIDGWRLRYVINGVVVDGKDFEVILPGGLSADVLWPQGRSKEYAVQGYIDGSNGGCFIIHPETISGIA